LANSRVKYGITATGKPVALRVTSEGKLIISTGSGPYPEAANFAALPDATIHTGEIYVVTNPTGVIWVNKKKAGQYISDGGSPTDWRYLGVQKENFNDSLANFFNDSDNTKKINFDISNVTTGTTRTWIAPDRELDLNDPLFNSVNVLEDFHMPNNMGIITQESGGANRTVVRLTSANILHLGDSQPRIRLRAGSTNALDYNSTTGIFEINGNSIDMNFVVNKLSSGEAISYDSGNDTFTQMGLEVANDISVPPNTVLFRNDNSEIVGSNNLTFGDNITDGFVAGSIETPVFTGFGGGNHFTNGMKVWTFDGVSTYVDVSSIAASESASTFTFPNNLADNAIYLSNDRVSGLTSDLFKSTGLRSIVTTALDLTAGEMVCEYYNGSIWTDISKMVVGVLPGFFPEGNTLFQNTGTFFNHFNIRMLEDWAKNDLPGSGTDSYWVRFRIVTPVTTLPVFEHYMSLSVCLCVSSSVSVSGSQCVCVCVS